MTEEWRPVVGYEGNYEVSDWGRIRSIRRRRVKGGLKKTRLNNRGYLVTGLYWMGRERTRHVHALVMEAFVGPRPAGIEVRHLDGDPTNAALTNLAYGTSAENKLDQVRHGTHYERRRTHCPQGHPYDEVNTYVLPSRPNARYCRTCHRERSRRAA